MLWVFGQLVDLEWEILGTAKMQAMGALLLHTACEFSAPLHTTETDAN